MKQVWLFYFVLLTVVQAQTINFNRYFENQTLRIDYYHTGNAQKDRITIDRILATGEWAGHTAHLIDTFNNGVYYVKVFNVADNRLIYSHGFNSYFAEYQTTEPARSGSIKTFSESVLIPKPRAPFYLAIQKRDKNNILQPLFSEKLVPQDFHILQEQPKPSGARVVPVLTNGDPHHKADLVFLSEGYRKEEFEQFKKDLMKRTELLFSIEPYSSHKQDFNVNGVFCPSADSGVDEPRRSVYKRTCMNFSFNALDLPRYLLSKDNRAIRDLAGQVPYDAIFIMVNSTRYGGGGIYNQFAVFTAHSPNNELVFVHEFGHSFAGLADEYYTSDVAYNDFYPKGVEPTEPNITALLDSAILKWPNQLDPGKAVPTNWHKTYYDSLSLRKQLLRRRLRRFQFEQVYPDSQKLLRDEMTSLDQALQNFISNHPLRNKTGFFEGAGYASHSLYRPMLNCMMFSNQEQRFCSVCSAAIVRMIRFYAD